MVARLQNIVDNPIAKERIDVPAHVLVYISDEALEFLTSKAIDLGYMQPQQKNLRGFSDFVKALSNANFYDARPEEFQAMDEAMLQIDKLPEWDMGFSRMRRNVLLSPRVQARLMKIAMEFSIFNRRRSDSLEHSSSIIGCLLEAIGVGFLKPNEVKKAQVKVI